MLNQIKQDQILIITEDDILAKSIIDSLSTEYICQRSFSNAEALSSITYNIPNLIIAENKSPENKGLGFLKTLRNGIKTKLIPFIIISKNNDPNERIISLDTGADAFLLDPFIYEELISIVKSKLNIFKEFYLLSITDELTRLYNRREFIKKFNEEINLSSGKRPVSLSIIDIDFFKIVNDKYGHPVGDKVLMTIAEKLKEKASDSFFPARFGGEEFVILHSDCNIDNAKKTIENLLNEFSSISFDYLNQPFKVTFSAGIAEYPSMGVNASELLSRADQALYAAKDEGRNRVYTFSPIMARNDKFWDYMKIKKWVFVDNKNNDPVTQLPYLPNLLETLLNIDFDIKSIGILIIKITPSYDIIKYAGLTNYYYDIENISKQIFRSSQMIFPSDTYMGISDLYNYEFIVMFPSVADFFFNLGKFNEICREIGEAISNNLKYYCIDISETSDVIMLDKQYPRKIYSDISSIRNNAVVYSFKKNKFDEYVKQLPLIDSIEKMQNFMELKTFFSLKNFQSKYQYFSVKGIFEQIDVLSPILEHSLCKIDQFENFVHVLSEKFTTQIKMPLLFPWVSSINIAKFINIIQNIFKEKEIIILINENDFKQLLSSELSAAFNNLPANISFGIDNCFIGTDILNLISINDFKLVIFSENISRNLHLDKEKVKIISGVKIFLDQLGIISMVKNISQEEEFQVITDLNINYLSGCYVDDRCVTQ